MTKYVECAYDGCHRSRSGNIHQSIYSCIKCRYARPGNVNHPYWYYRGHHDSSRGVEHHDFVEPNTTVTVVTLADVWEIEGVTYD